MHRAIRNVIISAQNYNNRSGNLNPGKDTERQGLFWSPRSLRWHECGDFKVPVVCLSFNTIRLQTNGSFHASAGSPAPLDYAMIDIILPPLTYPEYLQFYIWRHKGVIFKLVLSQKDLLSFPRGARNLQLHTTAIEIGELPRWRAKKELSSRKSKRAPYNYIACMILVDLITRNNTPSLN